MLDCLHRDKRQTCLLQYCALLTGSGGEGTHTRSTALSPGLPGWAGTRKVKPTWILLKQETVSGSGISWAICKSASRSRQITTPAPHHSVFTGRMPFLLPNQQCQITEGTGGGQWNTNKNFSDTIRYDMRCYFNVLES